MTALAYLLDSRKNLAKFWTVDLLVHKARNDCRDIHNRKRSAQVFDTDTMSQYASIRANRSYSRRSIFVYLGNDGGRITITRLTSRTVVKVASLNDSSVF